MPFRYNGELLRRYLTEALLEEDLASVFASHYANKLDRNSFDKLIALDPTFKEEQDKLGTYGKWILANYLREGSDFKDNLNEVTALLKRFDEVKNRLKNKDINNFKKLKELQDYLDDENSYNALTPRQDVRSRQKARKEADLDKDAALVYEDADWKVYIPFTYAASCKLGADTQWCTATTESDKFYKKYKEEHGGEYYININKHTGDKYQFHFESLQFKDKYDGSINIAELDPECPHEEDEELSSEQNDFLEKIKNSLLSPRQRVQAGWYPLYKFFQDNPGLMNFYKNKRPKEWSKISSKLPNDADAKKYAKGRLPAPEAQEIPTFEELVQKRVVDGVFTYTLEDEQYFWRADGKRKKDPYVELLKELMRTRVKKLIFEENKNLQGIFTDVFAGSSVLEEVVFSKYVVDVDKHNFMNCPKLTRVSWPEEIGGSITIAAQAFANTNIKELKLPRNSYVELDASFANMPRLEKIIIPGHLVYLNFTTNTTNSDKEFLGIFENDKSLREIHLPGAEKLLACGSNVFKGVPATATLYIPWDKETYDKKIRETLQDHAEQQMGPSLREANPSAYAELTGAEKRTMTDEEIEEFYAVRQRKLLCYEGFLQFAGRIISSTTGEVLKERS